MSYGLKLIAFTGIAINGGDQIPHGSWVQSYNPDAHDGYGDVTWTTDPEQALAFTDPSAALDCYRLVPLNRPTRPDGQPNRPLTAFTIEVEEITLDAGATVRTTASGSYEVLNARGRILRVFQTYGDAAGWRDAYNERQRHR